MPDVFTHLMIGASLALILRPRGTRAEQMLIILGSVIIDIERPVSWILEGTGLDWIGLSSAFHSLLGAAVLSYFAATCFDLEAITTRSKSALVLIGGLSHLVMDMTMYPWAEHGLYILYPLKVPFSFHLLWPDFWFYPLIGAACFVSAVLINRLMLTRLSPQSGKAFEDGAPPPVV